MKVVLTGASGPLGRALVDSLRGDGHDVVRLVRRPPAAMDEARWDPRTGYVDTTPLVGADAVVNLAGPGLGDRPWTPGRKRAVLEDRVAATRTIATAIRDTASGPRTLISQSAVGYYGRPGDLVMTEDSPRGEGYVAQLAAAWEDATQPAVDAGIRVVRTRTAVVVSRKGGAFGRLLPIFRLGLGGRIGSGRQWWSWVALADYVAAVRFLLSTTAIDGPVNIAAPEPIRNEDLTAAMSLVLHRPAVLPVPAFAVRLPLGDFGEDLLAGQRVVPARLVTEGFTFRYPSFEPALRAVLDSPASTS